MKKTQLKIVRQELLENGEVTRNWCLTRYISRLGAIICYLKEEGWEFEAGYLKTAYGRDYRYKVTHCPYTRREYRVNGKLVSESWEKL